MHGGQSPQPIIIVLINLAIRQTDLHSSARVYMYCAVRRDATHHSNPDHPVCVRVWSAVSWVVCMSDVIVAGERLRVENRGQAEKK